MTLFDVSVIGASFAIAGGFYAYLLIERRKLHRQRKPIKRTE
ncbi:hypothetical protein BH10PSE12_BH10PSE12_05080 [soil metagenome]